MIEVEFTYREIIVGAHEGMMRSIRCIRDGATGSNAQPTDARWSQDIEGALAEMAFAKVMNLWWSGLEGRGGVDVGTEWEVRSSTQHHHRLIIRKDDDDAAKFVFVTGERGQYRVHGWMSGRGAKKNMWWEDPVGGRPAYFVPQDALKSFG